MLYMFKDLTPEEIDQSVLEVLSFRHSLEHMSRDGLFRSMFQHLDKDASVRPITLRPRCPGVLCFSVCSLSRRPFVLTQLKLLFSLLFLFCQGYLDLSEIRMVSITLTTKYGAIVHRT